MPIEPTCWGGFSLTNDLRKITTRRLLNLIERSRSTRATATTALELDEGLAEAHTSLAWVKRVHDWDWTGSEREFRRALELNPNDVNAHQWYALLLITLGRLDEALSETEQARELAPLTKIVL